LEYIENLKASISEEEIAGIVESTLSRSKDSKKVLVIHTDYTRTDFTHIVVVFCKLKFLTSAKIFPQAPVGNFFDQKAA
jgi:nickel-dependent lactate racemase